MNLYPPDTEFSFRIGAASGVRYTQQAIDNQIGRTMVITASYIGGEERERTYTIVAAQVAEDHKSFTLTLRPVPSLVPDPDVDISFGKHDVRAQGARDVTPDSADDVQPSAKLAFGRHL